MSTPLPKEASSVEKLVEHDGEEDCGAEDEDAGGCEGAHPTADRPERERRERQRGELDPQRFPHRSKHVPPARDGKPARCLTRGYPPGP